MTVAMRHHRLQRCACLLAAAGLLSIFPGSAEALTTRADLHKWCTHGSAVAAGRCMGYLLAAEDVLARDAVEGVSACMPLSITLKEQHRIVLEWMAANPDASAASAVGLVARAYAASYPCDRRRQAAPE